MNTKNTSKIAIRRAKETKLGRFLCRLAGEESGQAMMEYVVIAVVIAAACALIMAIWGKSIFGQAEVGIKATDGRPETAATLQEKLRTNNDKGITEAVKNRDKFDKDLTTKNIEN